MTLLCISTSMRNLALALGVLLLFCTTVATGIDIHCDIVVAGGSTAALATAISAAQDDSRVNVCLLEPTDWPGGQLTSSAVSAVDYGPQNRRPANQAHDFVDMMNSMGGPGVNLGNCWVSLKCYEPAALISKWIMPKLAALRNLRVFLMTAVRNVTTDGSKITSLQAIQRLYRPGVAHWNRTFSAEVQDWYSASDSDEFTKQTLDFFASVFVEATEYGDVLALAKASYHQGIEVPTELSETTDDTCGQCMTYPFYVVVDTEPVAPQHIPPGPPGVNFTLGRDNWGQIWSYRRSKATPGPMNEARVSEVSNQNWGLPPGNDDNMNYLLNDRVTTDKQVAAGVWAGGVNLTANAVAEQYGFGWFSYYASVATPQNLTAHLRLVQNNAPTAGGAGTLHGLSKTPYVRDTRRSVGLNGYMLPYADLAGQPGSITGTNFTDRVAIGDYFYADTHRLSSCSYPDYLNNATVKPFFIPFRALTNRDYGNLVVAGKTMAQTFHANSATRLHPIEYSSGVAAGCTATMMVKDGLSTEDIYELKVSELQARIKLQAPIDWTL